ncbi:NucA/NucB deoxyribonuclease domain-containing protein [Tsukamurella sp. 8F]|nr:NucA/NucB deoxyribonuclease domain-containing protein [Tsukamurella sp. 8F]MDF0585727.1 NucA/NucB deoxyribonuclease domain-containing protein [Tsukamurella sp. 8F]
MRMTSAADSGTVTVNVTAEVTATGTPVPGAWHLYLSYLDSDAPGGQSFKQFDVALVPGLVANGSGTFTPAAYNTAPPRTRLVYRWDDTTPVPGDNGVGATTSGLEVRCDNVVRATVGCVNPNYLPTVNFPNAPTVTSHIRAAQAQGKPSTLTKNSPATDANRRAACGNAEAVLGPKPSPDSTCDEYPFASTSEGGAGASIAWVPAAENSSQGGTLAGMTAANRVIDGDRYDVIP